MPSAEEVAVERYAEQDARSHKPVRTPVWANHIHRGHRWYLGYGDALVVNAGAQKRGASAARTNRMDQSGHGYWTVKAALEQ